MPLTATADRALQSLAKLSCFNELGRLSAEQLLMERAWLMNARFSHRRSPSGNTRLLDTADGTLAVAMVRSSDWELVPAWLETDTQLQASEASWQALAPLLAGATTHVVTARARLLGLAVAATGQAPRVPKNFYSLTRRSTVAARPADSKPRVVDLSALWAGPLCSHLLQMCGAQVTKVESTTRPDGARDGDRAFYNLLNQGKRAVSLQLAHSSDSSDARRILKALLLNADIVIESSRPRALRQMGIYAEEILAARPGLIWISITGYGRSEPQANWVAFGDDAGAAAGLSDVMQRATGDFQFAGDAIADPLTGIHAALAGWQVWREGSGGLLELSMADVAAWCLGEDTRTLGGEAVQRRFAQWWREVASQAPALAPARQPSQTPASHSQVMRSITHPVAEFGEHTNAVISELEISG